MNSADARTPDRHELAARLLRTIKANRGADSRGGPLAAVVSPESAGTQQASEAFLARYLPTSRLDSAAADEYAAVLSDAELQELIAFFGSPLGKKYLRAQVAAGVRVQQLFAEAYRAHGDELQQTITKIVLDAAKKPQ